jgi:hypothetical protein
VYKIVESITSYGLSYQVRGNDSVGGADEISGDGEQGGVERSKLGGGR